MVQQTGTAGSATLVASGTVSKVENLDETQNRKVVSIVGNLDLSAVLQASRNAEFVFGWLVWPKEMDFPTVAEWDPWSAVDVPGNPSFQGGVSAPFGMRRFAFGLPAGASNSTLGDPMRYRNNSQRLLKPGFELRWFVYSKASASVAWNLTGQFRVKVLN